MERNSQNSQGYKLESQIREAFGKVVYTETCHNKIINRLNKKKDRIKISQIVFSAITSTGIVSSLFCDEYFINIVSAISSLILLIINLYYKNFNLSKEIQEHKLAADMLWKIREEYISLLTDFESLTEDKIINKRNELQERTFKVYQNSPRTDKKSYAEARKALKVDEEQTFAEKEIDNMLPNSIRRCNRNYTD